MGGMGAGGGSGSTLGSMGGMGMGGVGMGMGGVGMGMGGVGTGGARMLRRILEDYLEIDSSLNPRLSASLASLLQDDLLCLYFRRVHVKQREVVFDVDQPADQIYLIERGEVEIVTVAPVLLEQAGTGGRKSRGGTGAGAGGA
ncbi:hypothetical protein B484DRAFT_419313, partial [Ochromonadaceae sp. CCMP2298]